MVYSPPSGLDLSDPEATKPVPGESQVISFISFHLTKFRVPMHPFMGRFLHHFGLWLHDLMPHRVAHLAVFVTPCECYLGIDPHFDLWRQIFHLNLNKDDDGSVQWIGTVAIQLGNNLKPRYLATPLDPF